MNMNSIHRVYFLGIGGIGMSALARWFNARGLMVSGYDRTNTPLTTALIEEGIGIHFDDNPMLIDADVLDDPEGSLVVYTPAIPVDHKEKLELINRGFTLYKRSEVLGMITANHYSVAVAGTHGKTSTSSIIAHILYSSGVNCAAFVGGIMANYNSNILLPKGEGEVIVVVEADEFDRSFLRLSPDVAVVTAADPDHLDIYGDGSHLHNSFREFINKVDSKGKLFIKERVADELDIAHYSDIETQGYDVNDGAIKAENIRVENGAFVFDYTSSNHQITGLKLGFPGRHNVENAIAAISVALHLNVEASDIKKAISTYKGVKRRFEEIAKTDRTIYYDDYAHHPEEIKSFISGLRELHPNKKVTVIFQPHLYTRTRDFADGFVSSLMMADEVILIPIYPAREKPIEGVNSEMLVEKIPDSQGKMMAKEEVVNYVSHNEFEVLATVGAGDIDQLVLPIKEVISERK